MDKKLYRIAMARAGRGGRVELGGGDLKVCLDAGSLLSLDGDLRGVEIESSGGPLWVTQTDDADDHILAPRESYLVERVGRVVVQAIETASVRISAAGRVPRRIVRGERGDRNTGALPGGRIATAA
jgi:hypothetical protein